MARDSIFELVFLMLILKIPIIYLCAVVYYAIKAEPLPPEGAPVTAQLGPESPRGWRRWHPRNVVTRPHGGPTRTYPRTPQTAAARAEAARK